VKALPRGYRVIWNFRPRGGYGYVIPVPATVVFHGAEDVVLDADLKGGGTKRITVKRRNVWSPCEKCRPQQGVTYACGCDDTDPAPASGAGGTETP
jgi:hypothetical protein